MFYNFFSYLFIPAFLLCSCGNRNTQNHPGEFQKDAIPQSELQNLSSAYFASGCFWCVEAVFESVEGVREAVSGYAGGTEPEPTYEEVSRGLTTHAETVKVYYDTSVIDFPTLLEVYYGSHDPTTVNGQHPDYGKQYRSIIFYENEDEKEMARSYKLALDESGKYGEPIATEIRRLDKFWQAEEYHQDYERKNPDDRYIRNVSIPRINKFKEKHPELLKDNNQKKEQ